MLYPHVAIGIHCAEAIPRAREKKLFHWDVYTSDCAAAPRVLHRYWLCKVALLRSSCLNLWVKETFRSPLATISDGVHEVYFILDPTDVLQALEPLICFSFSHLLTY